jgi:acetyltransferase-like isoleucine patch superfamily enzyme
MGLLGYASSRLKECYRLGVIWVMGEMVRYRYPDLVVGYCTIFRFDTLDALTIGSTVNIGPFGEIVAIRETSMSTVPGGLVIGSGTAIGAFANIRAAGGTIEIGSHCMIGQYATLVAANHGLKAGEIYAKLPYDQQKTGVRIGSNVWLGAGVVVLPGTSIGTDSVVAAGAVVTRDIPAGEVWAGIPARRIASVQERGVAGQQPSGG